MTTKLHSLPTQLAALQGMCIRKAAVRGMILAQVDESHMYHDECKEVLRYILDTIDRKGEPPVFELLKENPKLSKETREMLRANLKTKVDVPVNRGAAQDLVDQLNHFRQLRIFYGMCMDGMELLRKKSLEVNDMTSLAETALAQLRVNKALKDQIIHFDEASMQEVVKDILWGEDTDNYIPTGWECFDAVNGGFPLEALVVLGGASGAGKSHMVAQLAKTQAMAGYKVAVVPLEMSRTEFTIRTLANIAGIDSLKMSRKTLTQEEKELIWKKFRRYQRRVERTGGRLTFYNPSSDVTIEETLAALHAYDPDIIYIDYIGLLKGAASEDQWRQLGNIARAAKVYAGNHKKVVVLAAQVDEEGRIRYSQTIKEHATLAFTFAATKETREQHILNINMLKGRNQQLIDFRLHIDYSTSTLKDPPASSMDSSSSSSPSSRTNNPGKPAAKKPAAKREKELAIELD